MRIRKISEPKISPILEEYSLEEKIVGTWTDGKPIYRKSFQGDIELTLNPDAQDWYTNVKVLNTNIDNIIDVKGYVYYKNIKWPVLSIDYNLPEEKLTKLFRILVTSDKELRLGIFVKELYDTSYDISVEYTKTTD